MSQKIEKIKEEKRRNEVKLRQLKHEQKALEAEGKGLRRRERGSAAGNGIIASLPVAVCWKPFFRSPHC